jgi:hypothetical protein
MDKIKKDAGYDEYESEREKAGNSRKYYLDCKIKSALKRKVYKGSRNGLPLYAFKR